MELLLVACLGLSCCILGWWWRFRPEGWVAAWGYLIGTAAIGRALLYFPPPVAPRFTQGLIFASTLVIVGSLFLPGWRRARGPSRWEAGSLLVAVFFAAFILLRHFHPVYDIDSLTYHMPSLVWLYERPALPPFMRVFENHHSHFRMIGFEELLATPGLTGNLPFFMALLQGLFKVLGFLTFASCLPSGFWLGNALLLLFCGDEFFLYSGINRWYYLNPAFLALLALAAFFCWRAWRGHRASFWLGLCIAPALAAAKYHGILVAPAICAFLALCCVKTPSLLRFPGSPGRPARALVFFFFMASLSAAFEVYGINWLETGSPLFPLGIGRLRSPNTLHTVEALRKVLPAGDFWRSFFSPYQTMHVFPANRAMSACFFLMAPSFLFFLLALRRGKRKRLSPVRKWLKARLGIAGGSVRGLGFLSFAAVGTWIWAAFAQALSARDPRFPNLIFGLSALMVVHACFHWRPRKLGWLYGRSWVSLLIAVAACARLAMTADTPSAKLLSGERPKWGTIREFVLAGGPPPLSVENPLYSAIFDQETRENMPQILACLRSRNLTERDFVTIAMQPVWATYLIGSLAPRADPYAVFSPESLRYFRFALVPRVYLKEIPPDFHDVAPGAEMILKAGRSSPPLCGSSTMALVRI